MDPHTPLVMDAIVIPETAAIKVLGFKFDSLLTWAPHIIDILGCARQRVFQLYCCRTLIRNEDLTIWIRPILEYSNIFYSGAATTHLHHLDNLQSWIEQTCSFDFPTSLLSSECWHYGISLSSFSWRGL